MVIKPALNEPKEPVKPGSRPYEMEGRQEDRTPLFGFEDVSGWTVECVNGADAELVRTREQQLWGNYVGKLTYSGTSTESRITLRPPNPIPIPNEFDCMSMWIYGNLWEWAPEPGTPPADIYILLLDNRGSEQRFHLTRMRWKEWWLVHKQLADVKQGWSLAGIEVHGLSNSEPRSIFLDSVYFYKEVLKPLRFEPRPKRNLRLPEGQSPGLNTGPGVLPFPTREETILPTNFQSDFRNWTSCRAPGRYEFGYSGSDCDLKYVYEPKTGSLGEIRAYLNGRRVCVPMANGGIEIGEGTIASGRLVSAALEKDVLTATFDLGGTSAIYKLRILQKSLVIDFECRGGQATGVALGEMAEVENPRLVRVPYITLGGGRDPRVLCWGKPEEPIFASVWVDWYRSNGSLLWSEEWVRDSSAKINGGVRYVPKTDGKRNDLFDRIFLTISPIFEETLPTIANPKTPYGESAGERLWQESWGPDDYAKQHERSRVLRSYGIEKLTQCNHEITWRDGGESFTLRTKAAPGKGGDDALKDYVAKQKSLGWLSGLYTNYCDFAPVNEYWDEDHVQRTPDGQLRPAWPRCYALKPSRAVEFDAKLAPIIKKKFGSNAAYTDVHTAASPWGYVDFDARVPGAGTFAATFYAYGELLLNDQKVYGPTWSEGTFQWLYAGLAAGNYGLCYGSADLSKEPLNVAFDLMKIHPLELDIGMPWTGGFLKEPGWDKPENLDSSIDHFIAATIAYGHIGWLVEETYGIQRTCRSYYMLQQLQKRYALRKPTKVEYADADGRFVTVSKAIATGIINDSRLHVLYENGLELFVNGSQTIWTIRVGKDRTIDLPPWGWYAVHNETHFEEFSALVDGRRVDYVTSPEYEYLDGRGTPCALGGIAAKGGVAVRRSARSVEVIDIYANDEIGIAVPFSCRCTAFDADGKSLGSVEVRKAGDGRSWFKTLSGARKYVLTAAAEPVAENHIALRFAQDSVVPGQVVEAKLEVFGRLEGVSFLAVGFEGAEPVVVRPPNSTATRTDAVVSLVVPKNAVPGTRLWVRAAAEWDKSRTCEAWYPLRVVPAFEIALKQTGPNQFRIDVHSNLRGVSEPRLRCSLKSVGSDFVLQQDRDDPRSLTISLNGEPRTAEGIIIVEASSGEFFEAREFSVRSTRDYPLVWQLSANEGFETGYAYRDGVERAANPASGATFQIEDMACGGVVKHGIFAHPPWIGGVGYSWGLTRKIKLPAEPCEFQAFIGLRDGGLSSDGVLFTVLAVDESGREHVLIKEHWAKREWKPVTANLSQFSGRTIRLKYVTDVGPNDNSNADWACWGEPRIVLSRPVARLEIQPRATER